MGLVGLGQRRNGLAVVPVACAVEQYSPTPTQVKMFI